MRRALVVGHDHIGGTGHVGAALSAAGWTLERFTVVPEDRFARPDVTVTFPDATGHDLVVTLGAPWPRQRIASWAGDEVAWLAALHGRGVPLLGVCAGAQFLAEALGSGAGPLGESRVGWFPVRPSGDAVPAGPWFQWHADAITAPPRAEVLADSADGVEAFRVGTSVGVQFHPEMSVDLLERWLAATPVDEARASDLRTQAAWHEPGAGARAVRLLRGLGLT